MGQQLRRSPQPSILRRLFVPGSRGGTQSQNMKNAPMYVKLLQGGLNILIEAFLESFSFLGKTISYRHGFQLLKLFGV